MVKVAEEKGFTYKGKFSKSADFGALNERMARRLEFVRSLKSEQDSPLNKISFSRETERQN